MCGIVGLILKSGLCDEQDMRQATASMGHRGPDGWGVKILQDGHVGLGHRRLSIIDLSESGKQPMSNGDRTLWITFNGEIYNYKAIREELRAKGHEFVSQSDTEVLVHAYEEWGEHCLVRLDGMFAFAIWDTRKERLFVARDRFGIKPLYYYNDSKALIFASEFKAMYHFEQFRRDLNLPAVIDYLNYYVIPSSRTVWKNAHKLLPGHYLTCGMDLKPKVDCYWNVTPGSRFEVSETATDHVDRLLSASVREHLESDVPVGIFLSSGYDSSALLAYARSEAKELNTFSIGFKDSVKTEHIEAAAIAKHFATNHFELVLEEDYMDILEDLWSFYDEPFAVTSMVSYYYVSRLAAAHNKVVFSGDGGDEVFGGYSWYRKIESAFKNRSWWDRVFRSGLNDIKEFYQRHYFSFMGSDLQWVRSILSDEVLDYYPENPYWAFELPEYQWKMSPVKVFQLLDFKYFIPDVALPRADRSSMATSLEVRVPMLDHRLVEYLTDLDTKVYFKDHVKKYLLYENIKNRLPETILNLPKKGFGNPLDPFFQRKASVCERLREGHIKDSRIFRKDLDVEKLNKKQLWLLYNFELWWSHWHR